MQKSIKSLAVGSFCLVVSISSLNARADGAIPAVVSTFLLGGERMTWYQDLDSDLYGNDAVSMEAYTQPADYVEVGGDCDDGQADINPGVDESVLGVDDGVDNDCDGYDLVTWYRDEDEDTWGLNGPSNTTTANTQPSFYANRYGDCNDSEGSINPDATEIPDGIDQNCNFIADEGTIAFDDDGDGYCEGLSCTDGSTPGDCDDSNPNTNPSAPEIVDDVDNNCDGQIDEPG